MQIEISRLACSPITAYVWSSSVNRIVIDLRICELSGNSISSGEQNAQPADTIDRWTKFPLRMNKFENKTFAFLPLFPGPWQSWVICRDRSWPHTLSHEPECSTKQEKVYLTEIIIIKTNEIFTAVSTSGKPGEGEGGKTIRKISSSTFTAERYFITCTRRKRSFLASYNDALEWMPWDQASRELFLSSTSCWIFSRV